MQRRLTVPLVILTVVLAVIGAMPGTAQSQAKNCPGAPNSRLAVGGHGQVTPAQPGQPSIPVRVREAPGTSGKILGLLKDGTGFEVKEGPTCQDNYAWWSVTADGVAGWIAEGDSSGYFVEPTETSAQVTSTPAPTATAINIPTPTLAAGNVPPSQSSERFGLFAEFKPGQVDTAGALPPYTIAPDFGNVVLAAALSSEQLGFLQRNGFVVSPGNELEFFTVYEKARYNYEPLFITTDSMLHSFHLVFDKVLRTAEQNAFIPLLRSMNESVLIEADKLYQSLKGTDWEEAARRTVAYVGVSARLLDANANVPAYAVDLVNQEVTNANNAGGLAPSALFPELERGEDWSQYTPRGHYTKTDQLKTYFRAMMYYGRMTFRLSKPEETKSALLLSLALRDAKVGNKTGVDAWQDLYQPTVFFVGKSDDLSIPQYLQVIDQVYGNRADAKAIQGKGIDPFVAAAKALPAPKILGVAIFNTDDVDQETKGLRFMGQRFVWDAYVFRQLVYRNVGTEDKPRALPMSLDVFAALGSDRALNILDKEGATAFEKYNEQMAKLRGELSKLNERDWTETLYNGWLYTLNTLNQPVPSGYPTFMTNQAYTDRNLYAALGSFAELKHDTILYSKQAYAEAGGGGGKEPPPDPVLPPNYVEPVPLFWARLAALAEMTYDGLNARGLLDPNDGDTLKLLSDMARRFQAYSIKELKNQPLTEDEQFGLRFIGANLEKILAATADEYDKDTDGGGFYVDEDRPQAAVVADIATTTGAGKDKSQKVLEIGVGRVFDIYAAVPINGKLYLAHGAVFSFYEFEQPLQNRLTDEAWQKMLNDGKAPPILSWTFSFLAKTTVESQVMEGVRTYHRQMVGELWYDPVASYEQLRKGGNLNPLEQFMLSQLEPLAKARQYEGRENIETNYRSFDLKDRNTAIVTTREVWRGQLHNYAPDPTEDGPKIAVRGPYTLDVTYTLTKDREGRWSVSNVVVNGNLPAWTQTAG